MIREGQQSRCRNRRGPRRTLSLRQGLTKPVECAPMEENVGAAPDQKGAESQLGSFCSFKL
jgi:hypothetical protein